MEDLAFAWRSVRAPKSNAILLAKDGAAVGIGMGQVNRVDAARLAVSRAGEERARGAIAASDAFFPFADGLLTAAEAGATALIQPGGSMNDAAVIEAMALGLLSLLDRPRPKLFARADPFGRFVSALGYVPRDLYTSRLREAAGQMLAQELKGSIARYEVELREEGLARVHYVVDVAEAASFTADQAAALLESSRARSGGSGDGD